MKAATSISDHALRITTILVFLSLSACGGSQADTEQSITASDSPPSASQSAQNNATTQATPTAQNSSVALGTPVASNANTAASNNNCSKNSSPTANCLCRGDGNERCDDGGNNGTPPGDGGNPGCSGSGNCTCNGNGNSNCPGNGNENEPEPEPTDTSPDAFSFATLTDLAPGLIYNTEAVVITGINTATPISIEGGRYSIDDGAFTNQPGEIHDGQTLTMQLHAPDAFGATTAAVVTVGDITAPFEVSTGTSELTMEVAFKELRFNWQALQGVSHYRLLENADGNSGFSVVLDDIPGDAENLSHGISAHLTDWINARYALEACNENGCKAPPDFEIFLNQQLSVAAIGQQAPTHIRDIHYARYQWFGHSLAISSDGKTIAIGAPVESGGSSGINNDDSSLVRTGSGSVYVFSKRGDGTLVEEAYIKASFPDARDNFGISTSLSADGSILAVGANLEDSASGGINGDPANDSYNTSASGAAYIFERDELAQWKQKAYIKAPQPAASRLFGSDVALSANGTRIAVGTAWHNAVFIYDRNADSGDWEFNAQVNAPSENYWSEFGKLISLSADGKILAVGHRFNAKGGRGINPSSEGDPAPLSGAVYIFSESSPGAWIQEAFIKASNADAGDLFGTRLQLSASGDWLVVGAPGEGSLSTEINGDGSDNNLQYAGAAYIFHRSENGQWSEEAYLKAPYYPGGIMFGSDTAISKDGNIVIISASKENSAANGVGGDLLAPQLRGQTTYWQDNVGAAYVFVNAGGTWRLKNYVKAIAPAAPQQFGSSTPQGGKTIGLSGDGKDLVIGAYGDENLAGSVFVY